MKNTLFLLMLLLTTACAHGPYPVSSPYFQIPAGSRLVLKQALTIAAESGRVYLQAGKPVKVNKRDPYYPHCWFLSWTIADKPTTILPDEFVITFSDKRENLISSLSSPRFASIGTLSLASTDTQPSIMEFSTVLHIHSEKQPDIRRLICSHWDEPSNGRHLTLAQINAGLNGIAEIKLPGN